MRRETINNAFKILTDEGVTAFIDRTKVHIKYMRHLRKNKVVYNFKDVLFINGCTIGYCERYRVHHKMQELMAYGLSVDEVVPAGLSEEIIKYYRAFVIYRAPWDESLDNFVKMAHQYNKVVFYDIDDLIFDLKYTNTIKTVKDFNEEEKKLYDDGVIRYRKLLKCCDYGITTTNVLADEMKSYVKDVCIDKNISSLSMQKYSNQAIKEVKKDNDKIIIGYASGSITHNDDFKMISDSLLKILDKYNNVYLKLIGVLDIPDDYLKYRDRIITCPFVDYKKLPYVLRSLDINIAPLEESLFNSAKSAIKWMEAGLVKVPTVASDIGDFHDSITDGIDGILSKENEWFSKLEILINNKKYREEIGLNAYKTVYEHYTPTSNGKIISDFIVSKLKKNISFILPAANISGGTMVATKHAIMLKKRGYDVVMLNMNMETSDVTKLYDRSDFVPVVSILKTSIEAHIDTMVATMWCTLNTALAYSKCKQIKYLVQNKESGFYEPDTEEILMANSTYNNIYNVDYLTISKWCQNWLKNEFNTESKYAPNGIDLHIFPFKKRDFNSKIKILIEGDPESYYKNVDESFMITNKLDRNKFEIHFLSYNAKPKNWYIVDKFYNKVDHDKVYKIYQNCDILLKSSLLESFSYPPLEMMATGGLCVVVPNDGNIEYLKDRENCLLYEHGDIDSAIEKINELIDNSELRNKLIENGLKTAKEREWHKIEEDIIKLYIS